MGGLFSRPESTPQPPSPTFSKPWRNINWGNKGVDLQYVKEYQTEKDDVKLVRILLYGPVGAGKSSFVNSVSSVLRGKISLPAAANNSAESDKSYTKKHKTHEIRKEKGNQQTVYPFVFTDIMGLEEGSGSGVRPDDIKLALNGHVRDGYTFNPVSSLSSGKSDYNPQPSADDKVHILVCVLSANSAEIKASVLQKIKDIRQAAHDLEIPQIAIMTKIDEACGETEEDLRNVYKSKHLKKKMKDFSAAVGIPMNCIFPIKNYSEEIDINDDVDSLILSTLRRMIDIRNDSTKNAQ
ncbi:interferon-induced protein 44-like [Acanthopagrus latus]|uniref:interferon-induced protein 44-like n=1 Tax=Acanthopagrus latus TaxID=8177 RepID=UPI00187C9D62|nr:interferon-induced protein 44-like [Acanthopagrus latus]